MNYAYMTGSIPLLRKRELIINWTRWA